MRMRKHYDLVREPFRNGLPFGRGLGDFSREELLQTLRKRQVACMIGEIDPWALPGMGTPTLSTEVEFLWGILPAIQVIGVTLDSTAVDANSGNSPTTTLIRGLVLGMQSATNRYAQYNPTATDGTQNAVGLLYQTVNMLNPATASAVNKEGRMVWWGQVKLAQARGLDLMARRQLGHRIWFDQGFGQTDPLRNANASLQVVQAQPASYQVLNSDNNSLFTTTGATGAIVFTLPATIPGRGWTCTFYNTVNQNMTITAPSGKLIALNNGAATNIAFTTASNKIGAAVEITVDDTGGFYMAMPVSTATATVS